MDRLHQIRGWCMIPMTAGLYSEDDESRYSDECSEDDEV